MNSNWSNDVIRFTVLLSVSLSSSVVAAGEPGERATEPGARSQNRAAAETVPFGVDLLPFVGTSSAKPNARRVVSYNFVAGLSGGIDAIEFSPAFGIATGSVRGAQLAGGGGITTADIDGAQIGGAFSLAAGDVRGVQMAGGVSVAAGDVHGLQFSMLNVSGGEVDGLQLGVFNVARRSTASIGVLSIMTDGILAVDTFGSDEGLLLGGLRHGGAYVYNIYHAGVRMTADVPEFAYGTGIGWRHDLTDIFEVSVDVTITHVFEDGDIGAKSVLVKLRPLGTWRPSPQFGVFGGPTLNLARTDRNSSLIERALLEFTDPGASPRVGMWAGGTLGLRFF